MTERLKLLVSVRDDIEALDAVAGGADWIDLKEPQLGPLGAVSAETATRTVEGLPDEYPVSAAMGELVEMPPSSTQRLLTLPRISVVKLGLYRCAELGDWAHRWHEVFHTCQAAGKSLAAVVYADWQNARAPAPEAVLSVAADAGCRFLLVDTFQKQGPSSIAILSLARLSRLGYMARRYGLTTALAGNLKSGDLRRVATLPFEIIAIRGAACRGGRAERIDARLVRKVHCELAKVHGAVQDLTSTLTLDA